MSSTAQLLLYLPQNADSGSSGISHAHLVQRTEAYFGYRRPPSRIPPPPPFISRGELVLRTGQPLILHKSRASILPCGLLLKWISCQWIRGHWSRSLLEHGLEMVAHLFPRLFPSSRYILPNRSGSFGITLAPTNKLRLVLDTHMFPRIGRP